MIPVDEKHHERRRKRRISHADTWSVWDQVQTYVLLLLCFCCCCFSAIRSKRIKHQCLHPLNHTGATSLNTNYLLTRLGMGGELITFQYTMCILPWAQLICNINPECRYGTFMTQVHLIFAQNYACNDGLGVIFMGGTYFEGTRKCFSPRWPVCL